MVAIIGFFLNLLWELLHSLLYDWNAPPLVNDIYVYIPRIIFGASCADAAWIVGFVSINSAIQKDVRWLYQPERRDYIVICLLGIIAAIIIEIQAMLFNMWEYNHYMPLILGIGLTPLVQLAMTGMLSVFLSTKIIWKKE